MRTPAPRTNYPRNVGTHVPGTWQEGRGRYLGSNCKVIPGYPGYRIEQPKPLESEIYGQSDDSCTMHIFPGMGCEEGWGPRALQLLVALDERRTASWANGESGPGAELQISHVPWAVAVLIRSIMRRVASCLERTWPGPGPGTRKSDTVRYMGPPGWRRRPTKTIGVRGESAEHDESKRPVICRPDRFKGKLIGCGSYTLNMGFAFIYHSYG